MKISNFIFKRTNVPILNKAMDAYTMRQRAISSNMANVATPGYRRKEVTFEEDLKKALDKNEIKGATTDDRHFPIGRRPIEKVEPAMIVPDDPSLASGLNNVNIEMEMAEQAKNSLRFSFATKLASEEFTDLRSSIRGENLRR